MDDGSPDPGIYDELRTRYPTVRFVRQDRNRGPAAARNRGAREASNELLLLVDSDTAVVPGTIDAVLGIYGEHPEFVACVGTTDKVPLNRGSFATYKAMLEASWVLDRRRGITHTKHIGSRVFTMRRSAMLKLGGFNEHLRTADVEDYEFGYRVRQAYGPIPFSTQICVRHNYDPLLTQARLYFRRVIMWWDLRSMSPGADSVGTTTTEAAGAILCTLTSVCLMAGILHAAAWLAAGGLAVAAIVANRRFLLFCLREHGLAFSLASFTCHTFLSWFICAGGTVALLRSIWRRLGRTLRPAPAGAAMESGDAR